MPKIMLDAGHYGNYNRGVIKEYYESNMAWELQGYLKAELESYGFKVGTTRTNKNTDLGVYDRGTKAKGYDLLLSLHSNAVSGSSVTKRVIVIKPLNGSANAIADALGKTILDTMSLAPDKYNYYECITKKYSVAKPKTDYYGVIRGAIAVGTPALILEHSFHTCPEACKWLMSSDNLKKLAKAEAKTLADHFGMKKKEAEATKDTLYIVQAGAFKNKANAEKLVEKLKTAGFDAVIKVSE